MKELRLIDFVNKFQDDWLQELIPRSRAFPSFKDGLKESTRAILTEVARQSDFSLKPIPAVNIIDNIPSYKEIGVHNVEKNLFRMASGNTPLIRVVANTGSKVQGLNRISGGNSAPRYVSVSLTPVGLYAMQYRDYFKTVQSDTDASNLKYKDILTPFPLSLIIPQANLADGVSNVAPNLSLVEVGNAYIEHLEKDKQTTTEDLVKHISGIELTEGSTVLMSNQSLYDLIERGVCKAVTLAPIEFSKDEFIIKELPYKSFGITIAKQLESLKQDGLAGKKTGFQSFLITSILPEHSKESFISVNFKLKNGYTINDVKNELYTKTRLKERLVYENIALDTDSNKPLGIKSVRQILDFHVDLGYELKRLEILRLINELEEKRKEAELMEKLTRSIVSDVVSRLLNNGRRKPLTAKYFESYQDILIDAIVHGKQQDYTEFPLLEELVRLHGPKVRELSKQQFGDDSNEHIEQIIRYEAPNDFTKDEIELIWNTTRGLIYGINKRAKALQILKDFDPALARLQAKLEKDAMREEIIKEIKELLKQYPKGKVSETLYALKPQEREERKRIKTELANNLTKMKDVMPVNVLIDKDFNAKLSFSKKSSMDNIIQVIEATTEDTLAVICRTSNSYKVKVSELTLTAKPLGNPKDIEFVTIDECKAPVRMMHLFLTNKGRIALGDEMSMYFTNKNLNLSLDADEKVIYFDVLPRNVYSGDFSLLMMTSDNKFKRKPIGELSLKATLSGMFNMFAGPSTCDNIVEGMIKGTTNNVLKYWHPTYHITNDVVLSGGFKRNVSAGDDLPFNGKFVIPQDKIPTAKGQVIPNLNLFKENESFNSLGDLVIPEDDMMITKSMTPFVESDIVFVKFMRTLSRRSFEMDFIPDNNQLQYLLHLYSKEETD